MTAKQTLMTYCPDTMSLETWSTVVDGILNQRDKEIADYVRGEFGSGPYREAGRAIANYLDPEVPT